MGLNKKDHSGVITLWHYRKEVISTIYLILIAVAFGAIWQFYKDHSESHKNKMAPLAFEEDHKIIDVVIAYHEPEPEPETEPLQTNAKLVLDAWKANAVQVADYVDTLPQISIVIDDLGLLQNKTLSIINLKAPLTLSFLPYANNLPNMTQMAKDRGHELMIHLPMEPKGNMNPGPHAMRKNITEKQLMKDLTFNLSQFEGYVGLNNHMGSSFTEYRQGLDVILEEIHHRGLLVLDSKTSRKSLLADMATEKNIPNISRDFFLDNEQNLPYILGQLEKLENMAYKNGHAIAIGHPYKETIEALSYWLPTLQKKGIAVVPLSHLVKRKYNHILVVKKNDENFATH
ncbi:MAG: divergent polysaccharide deacetylase family protein [Emcibacter sp.]|nr:divergent polysaccharide deacetylase family protein [Emcibacter sp.]